MKLPIIQKRKYYYLFSGTLLLISVISLIAWGLKPGLDFTGGSMLQVKFNTAIVAVPTAPEASKSLASLDLGEIQAQPVGVDGMIMRFKTVDEPTHQKVLAQLETTYKNAVSEQTFESVGPVIGQETKDKAWQAIFLASLAIVAYIAFAFRKVSRPVTSWKYGVAAIVALIHDLVIVTGLFSILGHFAGIEVDSLFITALLTILGFSVHDTIVVFDRTRENLSKRYTGDFEVVVNDSVNQTMARSINTSVTTLLVLTAMYLFGGSSTTNFALALIAGIIFGTYSSIFIASTLIVDWYKLGLKK